MISKVRAIAVGVFSLLALSSLSAQEIKPIDVYQDPNGIDLVSNNVSTAQIPVLSIPAAPELEFRDLADFIPLLEVVTGDQVVEFDPNVYSVSAGRLGSDVFAQCHLETCYASNGTGGMLVNTEIMGAPNPDLPLDCLFCPPPIYVPLPGDVIGGPGVVYRAGDSGRAIYFSIETEIASGTLPQPVKKYLSEEIRNADGVDLSIHYESINLGGILRHRPVTVTSTSGYQLKFSYFPHASDIYNWGIVNKAEIVALANPTVALASLTYSGNTVTDISGRVFECVCQIDIYPTRPQDRGSRMRLPGQTDFAFSTFRQQNSALRTVTADGVSYQYVSTPQPWPNVEDAIQDITITGPNGFYKFVDVTNLQATTGQFDPPRRRIESITDSLGRTTTYQYRPDQRLIGVTYPEGNAVSVVYDSFGNLASRTDIPKPSSGLSPITQSAFYPSSACGAAGFECYFPTWTMDGKGNRTDFTWSNGLLLTQLDPPDESGKRRKVKNTWSGTAPVSGEVCPTLILYGLPGAPQCSPRLIREEICETDTNGNELTCGTANSFVRQMTYFGTTSLPESVTVTDGAGNGPLTTTFTYDNAGRQLSVDGPLSGSDDATYARYDVLGRKIWEIGPKGENGLRPATRTTYRLADDQVARVETGMVAGTTPPPSHTAIAFVGEGVLHQTDTEYNTRRLAVKTTVSSGGTTQAITQMSYDALNREDCTAIRMNLDNPPADVCKVGAANSEGERDRITRKHYDSESRVVRIEQAADTSEVRDYATYTFTPNGQTASMTDARGYRAEMRYDGFDRQSHWYFPQPGQTGAINPNDYEQYGYDANGNRISLRKRDGSEITYQYDNLNRVIRKTVPERSGLATVHTRDVFYQYDVRGLQLWARFDSDSGVGTTSDYNRYGWVTSTTDTTGGAARTLSYQYLPDGQRWEITYPDVQKFRLYYWPGGQFNHITGPLGEVIVDYNYNNRNELREIARDTTAPLQQWTYDPIGRMASTTINSPVNAFDITWGYTRNPASQIRSESQSNDSYSWNGFVPVDRTYVTNGLNQYTSVSEQGYCHDKNGNLTADNEYVYLYDVENRLVEMRARGTGNTNCLSLSYAGQFKAELRYDPLGRLYQTTNYINGVSQGAKRYVYDGDALVVEYNAAGTMLARHLHGPLAGVDDPIAEYNGAGVTASNRTNLYTDARGSIVLRTSTSGGSAVINTYDEYGQPGSANAGRFQYTGQAWLPELGMYYYKARIYSPRLGRFLQTDPIGYEDNINLYGYVANDPINGVDPAGLATTWIATFLQGGGLGSYNGELSKDRLSNNSGKVTLTPEGGNSSQGSPGRGHNGGPPLDEDGADLKPGKLAKFGRFFGGIAGAVIGFILPEPITGGSFDDPRFPTNENDLHHIFGREKHGLKDTPDERALIIDATRFPHRTAPAPAGGGTHYWRTQSDGTEIWVSVRQGVIQNAARNMTPRYPPK